MESRTTRSGRAVKGTVASPLPTTRASRRNSKKTQEPEEQIIEDEQEIEETIVELEDEDDEPPNTQEVMDQLRGLMQPTEEGKDDNESNSNFAFEQDQTFEHSSNTNNENNEEASEDAPNTYIDGLDEENANSFPSGCDDNSKDNQEIQVLESSDEEAQFSLAQDVPDEDEDMQDEIEEVPIADEAPEIEYQPEIEEASEIDEKPLEQESNTTGESDFAIAENLENGNDKTATDLDAEMVSEEELPAPSKENVEDAEEVSDDELPGPKLAELPADTEFISEEELPNTQKENKNNKDTSKRKLEDYDPSSPTDDAESPDKKKVKTDEEDKAEKPKAKLPELDKFWKAVNDDSTDFTAWTYLLQYVDVENDIEAAREAYDAFLAHYPYCYGYWRKFADYEKRKGNKKKSEEVFERGLKAIPLSVDLWLHYLTHVKTAHSEEPDVVRVEFERALTACGLEFRSDKLWEAYIKWEAETKNIRNIVAIYERLLATPTQGYNNHFDNFQDVVVNNPVHQLVSVKEFKKLRDDVRKDLKESKEPEIDDTPPGADEPADHVRNDEEAQAIKDKITSKRKKIHKATVAEVTNRWTFEEGIKRPYFHVKPLERCQLKNWKEYLDFEIEQGNHKRILVLFERCLIACALYDEFWLKLIRYLETRKEDPDYEAKIRDAYERACTIHHPDKPSLHLMWSAFEETNQNFTKGAEILVSLEKACPNLLQVAYRRINLERRRQDYEKVIQLYDHYISISKNKNISGSLSIKYARFLHKIKNDIEGAFKVLRQALEKDANNTRAALQMIDLALQRAVVDEKEVLEIMDSFMAKENIEPEQKVLFAQRKVEFLEDFGSSATGLQEAQRALQTVLNKANETKKKGTGESPPKKSSKDAAAAGNGVAQPYGSSAYSYASGQNNQYYGNSAQYQSYGGNYDYNQQWGGYQQNQQQQAYGSYGYGYGSYY